MAAPSDAVGAISSAAANGRRNTPAESESDPSARIYQAGEARLASMESLRALAALAVLVGHVFGAAYLWRSAIYDGLLHRTILGGGFAVYLFFALSGYLLYLPFVRRDFATGS